MTHTDIVAALLLKCGLHAVDVRLVSKDKLRILGRIAQDPGGVNLKTWLILMYQLKKASESRPWKVDLSKSYFIREDIDRLVYAWRVLFEGPDIDSLAQDIAGAITASPRATHGEMADVEIPLAGVRPDRHRNSGPSGSVPVGAAAAHMKRMGG